MSSKSKIEASNVTLTPARQDVLDAAITPLLEVLEARSMFSIGVAPVANPGGPYTVAEGQSVQISGLGSTDSDGTVASYQWDTSYSNSRGFRNQVTSPTWTFTADDSGTKTIALKVVDNDGNVSGLVTTQINISDVAPTLSLTLPGNAAEASPVNITWAYTDPGVSDAVTAWNVDWGDSTNTNYAGSAASGSHVYDSNGTYNVTLTSTQNDATTSITQQLVVSNVTPVVNLSTNTQTIDEGARVKLNFASPNRAGTLDSWLIDWGDGKQDVFSPATTQALHLYTDSGSYTATVYAQEPDGGYGQATQAFTVNNVAPTVTQTGVPSTGTEGSSITIGSTVTDPGIDDTHTYGWTVKKDGQNFALPGGTTTNGTSFTFTPTDNGSYVVRLSVVDDEGAITTVNSNPIAVANATPTATVSGEPNGSIAEGTAVNLSVVAADAGSLDTFTYSWSVAKGGSNFALPNGTNTTGTSFGFAPTDNGTYAATVVVTDKDGAHVSAYSTAIVVTNENPTASVTGTPANGIEGTAISVTAGVTDAGTADTFTYAWSVLKDGQAYTLPNGVNTTASTFAFTPSDNGSYEIELTVTDDDNGTASTTSSAIVVANAAPTAHVTVPSTGTEGHSLTFNVAASDAGVDDTHTYLWTVEKDGQSYNLNGATDTATAFTFMPEDNGSYVVSVVVTDNDLDSVTMTQTVVVTNLAPTPAIDSAPTTADEGDAVTVTGSATDAGVNDVLTYAWTLTKDNVAVDVSNLTTNGTSFTFTPADNGTYVATLTVTDNDTAHASVSTSAIVVANVAPTAVVTGEPGANINEGDAVALTATATDAGTADTFSYAWSIKKDGQTWTPASGTVLTAQTLNFTPADNGTYVATVIVTDDDAATYSVAGTAIVVDNVDPTASITAPASSPEGTALSLTSTVADAGVADTQSYQWSVTRNGNAVNLTNVTTNTDTLAFTPRDNGAYVVTLVVTDDDGGTVTATSNITVTNAAPVPVISGNSSVNEDQAITLTVAANDPGQYDTHTYLWSVTRNGSNYATNLGATNGTSFTFTPNLYGSYVVSCVVTDNDTAAATATKTITVNNVAPTAAITGMPTGPRAEGSPITLHGTAGDVSGESGLTYLWSVKRGNVSFPLPGGTVVNTNTFEFTPTDNGLYKATLTVTDSGGLSTAVTTSNIVVTNALPDAAMTGIPGGNVNEGSAVNLHVDAADPGEEDTLNYAWTVTKNGQPFTLPGGTVANAANFSFVPTDNGTFVATCLVTDDDGGPVSVNSGAINVVNVDPVGSISRVGSGTIYEGTALTYAATVTDAGSADTHTYAWTATKDGQPYALSTADQQQLTFTPIDQGAYVLTLVVTDDDAGTHTSTQNVTVLNAAPVISSDVVATTGTEGVAISLNGDATDAGVNDTLTYSWTITTLDGSTTTRAGKTNTYNPYDNGTYTIRLTVTDKDGTATLGTPHTVVVANANPTVSAITAATTGTEGTAITASVTATDVVYDTVTLAWTVTKDGQAYALPNGTVADAASFTFTPTDNGSYVLTLVATDEDGGTATSSHTVAVANVAPTATITADITGNEGTAVNASVSGSDVAADTLSYAWTVTKNGEAYTLPGSVVANAASLAFTPTDNGSYVATCVVSDEDGGSVTKVSSAIVVSNVPPTVSVARVGSGTITEGDTVQFAATAADAGSDDVLSYLWTATKGGQAYALTSATAATLNFTPADQGSYVLTCTVTDDDAGTASASTPAITVVNAGPVITTDTVATTGTEGVAIGLSGDATDAGVNDVLSYAWTITKPDSTTVTLTGKNASFTPADNGSYTARLVVTDGDTGTATGTLHTIAVANANPTVSAITAPTTGTEGSAVTASVTATDVAADTISYAWTVTKDGQAYALPNGTTVNAASFTFTPTDNGSYTLTLVATDEDNGTTTVTHDVTVANANPTAAVTGDTSADEGSAVSVEVAASDVSSDDVTTGFTYAWSVTKNGLAYALPQGTVVDADTLAWTPADNGTYTASVVVTDKDNGTVTQTHNIVVDNVAPTAVLNNEPTGSVNEGSEISLSATATDPGTEDAIEYSWVVLKDGQVFQAATDLSTSTNAFAFTPTDNGSYVVKLYVTDGLGGHFYETAPMVVANVAPTATISGPTMSAEGSAVTITASASDVGSADEISYAWTATKNGDPIALPEGTVADAASLDYTPTDEGTYVFTCVISDDDNGSVTLTHELTVANVAPTVTQTDVPDTGVEGTAITVGSTATDPGSDTLTRAWSVTKNGQAFTLPDGTVTSGTGLTFTPTDNGKYVVRLSVNDGTETTTVTSGDITVTNAAPEAGIAGQSSVNEGIAASFSGTATDAGSLDTTAGFTYAWKARKGNSVVATGDERNFSFTPSIHGEYSVQLTVTDKDGTTTTTYSALTVANVAPKNVAIEGELEGITEGDSVHMVASADDVAGDTVSLAWKVMYGESTFASGTGDDISFTAARGQYSIVVTATDTAGATASTSVDIDVANVAPTAAIANSQNGSVLTGSNANFSLMFGDVPADQALDVSWDFGDGSHALNSFTGGSTVVKKHAYSEHGTYTVTATVSDGRNQTVVTTTIVVSEATMITDPMDPRKTALLVIGGDGNDVINVAQLKNGRYSVDVNGDNVGSGFAPTGRVYVYGNGGSNTITVSGNSNAVVFAGDKASSVTTGNGNDIVIGTGGIDRLNGGDGRDVLIGMAGGDVFRGGLGDDLLIAGGVAKTDTASLAQLGSKWADGNGSASARRNGVLSLFNKKSLISDTGGNQLYGEAGNDWFVIGSADKIKDLQKTDLVN